jgi:septum site-determining protein MinC
MEEVTQVLGAAVSKQPIVKEAAKPLALVTARGTEEGLVLRLDGRAPIDELKRALAAFVVERKGFLQGNEVVIEWAGGEPDADTVKDITEDLRQFNVSVTESRIFHRVAKSAAKSGTQESKAKILTKAVEREEMPDHNMRSLFDGMETVELDRSRKNARNTTQLQAAPVRSTTRSALTESVLWDDADSRLICTTLRSGQRIETEHSVIICGDVNSGAEIVAGGDIVVLGSLRGVAHAGAYEETGGGRFIFALDLRPTQLRIGTVITRGGAGERGVRESAEIARVDGDTIAVEKYQARQVAAARNGGV